MKKLNSVRFLKEVSKIIESNKGEKQKPLFPDLSDSDSWKIGNIQLTVNHKQNFIYSVFIRVNNPNSNFTPTGKVNFHCSGELTEVLGFFQWHLKDILRKNSEF